MTTDRPAPQRRRPKQARSRATCDAILEAAAQILERDGATGFNTNAVAERAGVSIGTLYQYFPDKQAILLEAAAREAHRGEPGLAERTKALLRALISALEQLGQGAPAPRAAASSHKRTRRRGSVIIRLQWAAPPAWLEPLLTPALLRARRPRR